MVVLLVREVDPFGNRTRANPIMQDTNYLIEDPQLPQYLVSSLELFLSLFKAISDDQKES